MTLADAGFATSLYFIFRTAGCFLGAFILQKMTPRTFFGISVLCMLAAMVGLFVFHEKTMIYICIALIGFGNSNIFPVIFSQALLAMPQKKNEVPAAADDAAGSVGAEESAAPTGKYGKLLSEEGGVRKLTGMYRNWFLDYASYVILERAVPHVQDGLKPVQRRILHAMKAVDDGRYNKVANIVGQTMQYHPHGDASIKDALVQLGQKDLLIDCQGNWGNILTGDEAAAGQIGRAHV